MCVPLRSDDVEIGKQREVERKFWKNQIVGLSRALTLEHMVPEKECSRLPDTGLFCEYLTERESWS